MPRTRKLLLAIMILTSWEITEANKKNEKDYEIYGGGGFMETCDIGGCVIIIILIVLVASAFIFMCLCLCRDCYKRNEDESPNDQKHMVRHQQFSQVASTQLPGTTGNRSNNEQDVKHCKYL